MRYCLRNDFVEVATLGGLRHHSPCALSGDPPAVRGVDGPGEGHEGPEPSEDSVNEISQESLVSATIPPLRETKTSPSAPA